MTIQIHVENQKITATFAGGRVAVRFENGTASHCVKYGAADAQKVSRLFLEIYRELVRREVAESDRHFGIETESRKLLLSDPIGQSGQDDS